MYRLNKDIGKRANIQPSMRAAWTTSNRSVAKSARHNLFTLLQQERSEDLFKKVSVDQVRSLIFILVPLLRARSSTRSDSSMLPSIYFLFTLKSKIAFIRSTAFFLITIRSALRLTHRLMKSRIQILLFGSGHPASSLQHQVPQPLSEAAHCRLCAAVSLGLNMPSTTSQFPS